MEVSRTVGYIFEVEKMNFDEALRRHFASITAEKSKISLDETLIIFNVGPLMEMRILHTYSTLSAEVYLTFLLIMS